MKNRKVILIVLAVLIVAAIGAGIYFLTQNKAETPEKAEASEKAEDLITVTVFRGDPGDQPTKRSRMSWGSGSSLNFWPGTWTKR